MELRSVTLFPQFSATWPCDVSPATAAPLKISNRPSPEDARAELSCIRVVPGNWALFPPRAPARGRSLWAWLRVAWRQEPGEPGSHADRSCDPRELLLLASGVRDVRGSY